MPENRRSVQEKKIFLIRDKSRILLKILSVIKKPDKSVPNPLTLTPKLNILIFITYPNPNLTQNMKNIDFSNNFFKKINKNSIFSGITPTQNSLVPTPNPVSLREKEG